MSFFVLNKNRNVKSLKEVQRELFILQSIIQNEVNLYFKTALPSPFPFFSLLIITQTFHISWPIPLQNQQNLHWTI